jgi:hypothetical protein
MIRRGRAAHAQAGGRERRNERERQENAFHLNSPRTHRVHKAYWGGISGPTLGPLPAVPSNCCTPDAGIQAEPLKLLQGRDLRLLKAPHFPATQPRKRR